MFSTWINRQLPIWSSYFIVTVISGLVVAAQISSFDGMALASASTALILFPAAFIVSAFVAAGYRGKNRRSVRENVIAIFLRTDPHAVSAPFLIALKLLIIFATVWQVALFASHAFKRPDLAALVVGASGIGGYLVSLLASAALYPVLEKAAKKISLGKATWLPLSSLLSSLIWCAALLLSLSGFGALLLLSDLRAADLTSAFLIFLINLVFVALLAWRLLKKNKSPESKPPVFAFVCIVVGLATVLFGFFNAHTSQVTNVSLGKLPMVQTGIALGRAITDFDRDGYSNLLGDTDCAAFNSHIYPGAPEVLSNGIDENCSGNDSTGGAFKKPDPNFIDPSPVCSNGDCNVVFISVDSLRADQLSFYGAAEVYMPHLEALAKKSVLFHNAYTPGPGTILTIPSMLAGLFDSQLEMDNRVRGPLPVSRNVTLIQESLSQKGIVTLAVLEHYYLDPLNQGWTKFYNPHSNTFYRESTVARQVDKILEYIDAYQDKPFFLFAHLNEPHHNYLLHKGFDRWGTNTWGRYRSELAFTDHHLKRVFDKIDRISNRRPTLIVLSADHGEGLGEHGIRFHNGGFYRELVWVPLIIHHPTLKPRQLEQPVSLLDIAPTLRNLYGLEPASRHVGTSLLGQIVNGDEYGARTIYHQGLYDQGGRYYNLVGISTKRYRLLHDMRKQTFEFFDLQNDPLEKNNLSDENGIPFQAMKKELLDWLEAIELKSSFVHRDWETAPPGAKRRRR